MSRTVAGPAVAGSRTLSRNICAALAGSKGLWPQTVQGMKHWGQADLSPRCPCWTGNLKGSLDPVLQSFLTPCLLYLQENSFTFKIVYIYAEAQFCKFCDTAFSWVPSVQCHVVSMEIIMFLTSIVHSTCQQGSIYIHSFFHRFIELLRLQKPQPKNIFLKYCLIHKVLNCSVIAR